MDDALRTLPISGFYSAAEDRLRLMHGLATAKILTPTSVTTLLTTRMLETHYPLGDRIRTKTLNGLDQETIWEDGSNRGFRMLAVRVRSDARTIIILNNTSLDEPQIGRRSRKNAKRPPTGMFSKS